MIKTESGRPLLLKGIKRVAVLRFKDPFPEKKLIHFEVESDELERVTAAAVLCK